jgi:dihydropteroate synthase
VQDSPIHKKKLINIKGVLHDFSKSKVMGIINLTPDSFYSESRTQNIDKVLKLAQNHLDEGADILDLGAYSSRPGAEDISEQEELKRLIPALKEVRATFPKTIISIDTFRSGVAREALEQGVDIINDISGGNADEIIMEVVSDFKAPYVLMHMQGTPQSMQRNPNYENVVDELLNYFSERIDLAYSKGINDLIIDPGIGFGKSLEHNYQILSSIKRFEVYGLPILIGVSRKSVVNNVLNTNPLNSITGTTALQTLIASQNNAIFRVHDVLEMRQVLKLVDYYSSVKTEV